MLNLVFKRFSMPWLTVCVFATFCCIASFAQANDTNLKARIAALEAENEGLRAQLEACGNQVQGKVGDDRDVLSLLRKLAQQNEDGARLALGLSAGPLILPEALLKSVVPNEYIVLFESGAEGPTDAAGVAALYGLPEAQVLHVYQQALSGFATRLSEAELARLRTLPSIAGVARNGRVFSTGVLSKEPEPLGFKMRPKRVANRASPVDVYLFDTGIRRSHRDLLGRVENDGFSFFDNGIAGEDCAGHGTHVAARIAGHRLGVSASAQLTSVKVIDRFGTGDVATVVAGIDWVMAQESTMKLVNMSLTRMVTEDPSPLDMAVTALIDSGAVVVVAAGNGAADASDFTPARVDQAITVGSVQGEALSDFSNAGIAVDIYAPGEAVMSASIRDICGVQEMSGTSMAAPFVTGLVADLLAQGTAGEDLVEVLKSGARRISTGAFAGETERFSIEPQTQSVAFLCD